MYPTLYYFLSIGPGSCVRVRQDECVDVLPVPTSNILRSLQFFVPSPGPLQSQTTFRGNGFECVPFCQGPVSFDGTLKERSDEIQTQTKRKV